MTVCGTPLWTAPEILRGQTYNEAADVYSFSLCLWELWAMSVPFNELGLGAMEVLLQVVNDGKRPTMPADIPPAFAELVSKCWATEPGERPTFADVVADIEVFTEMSGADPGHLVPQFLAPRLSAVARPGLGVVRPPGARQQPEGAGAEDPADAAPSPAPPPT